MFCVLMRIGKATDANLETLANSMYISTITKLHPGDVLTQSSFMTFFYSSVLA